MSGREELLRSVRLVARRAAEELEALAGGDGLSGGTKTARELCGVLKDAVALERELREQESAGQITVRFAGETEEAAR